MTVCSVIRSGRPWYEAWAYTMSRAAAIESLVLIVLVTYGLTYLLTMMLKNGKRAIIGTIVIMIVYAYVGEWLQESTGIALPSLALKSGAHTRLLATGWTLFALACPLGAQLLLKRAEV
jgi:hypothetical protein